MSDVLTIPNPIVFSIPMTPDRNLTPNKRGYENRWHRGPMIRAERDKAKLLADRSYFQRQTWVNPVSVNVTIHWGKQLGKDGKMRQARRLDWDSATTICKPMIDGALVDTGILADDRQIVAGTVYQTVDPTGDGFTTIEITAVEAARKAE